MGLIGVMEWCGAWEQVPGEGEALGQGLKVPLPTTTADQQRAPSCKGCSGNTSRKREQMPQLGWAPVGTPREAQSKGWAVMVALRLFEAMGAARASGAHS